MQISARVSRLRAEIEEVTSLSTRTEVPAPGRVRVLVTMPPPGADCWPELIAICRSVGRYATTDATRVPTLWVEVREEDDDD